MMSFFFFLHCFLTGVLFISFIWVLQFFQGSALNFGNFKLIERLFMVKLQFISCFFSFSFFFNVWFYFPIARG